MTEEKKNLFDRAIDALTNRDENAAKAAADKVVTEKAVALKTATDRATAVRLAANKAAGHKAATEKSAAVKAMTEMAEKTDATRTAARKEADEKAVATAPKKGVVTIKSLRIRADHNSTSEVVAGLVNGNEVSILSTWSDGKNTWAKLDKGWAAMVHDGKTYIKLA